MRNRAGTILLLALLLSPLAAAAQVPPDAAWREFDTEHFRVTFPEGLEAIARRAGDRAERAYAVLAAELLDPPRGRIDLVIADNVDFANGYATPIPTNRVVVYAHPPVDEPSLAYYDDWLHLVILHELVHIFHLDAAEGVWKGLRFVFGRSPVLFPHLLSPGWLVEGLATAYESRFTAGGRVNGTVVDMILRTAVLEDEFFTIDRASSDPIRWPAGTTRYAYGSFFVEHLARRYGSESVTEFVEEYGGRLVPLRLNSAAREAFGVSFTRAWAEWADSLRAHHLARAAELRAEGLTPVERLTTHGRVAFFPRYSPVSGDLAYAAGTGKEEPSIRLIRPDGRIETLSRANNLGPSSWNPDGSGLLSAELQFVDPYRIYSDLRWISLAGDDERMTRGARVWDADLHPDGRTAVVVTDAGGTNILALHDLETGQTSPITSPELDVQWGLPRWSPDGARIAASRWSPGGLYDVVIVDTAGTVERRVTRDRAIDVAPAWSPDGRYLVFASDRSGISNLYAFDIAEDTLFQVTNLLTGASHADVSADGRWIAFALYGAEGWDIARVPFAPSEWRPAPPVRPEAAVDVPPYPAGATTGGDVSRYSPFPSVLPAGWMPLIEDGGGLGIGLGAAAFGQDVVQRHSWSGAVTIFPEDARLAGGLGYRFRGFGNPVLDLVASQDWDVRRALGLVVVDGDTIRSAILERERVLRAGMALVRQRWRSVSWLESAAELNERDREWQRPEAAGGLTLRDVPLDLGATAGAGYASARAYGLSIGPQDGIVAAGRLEGHRFAAPFAGDSVSRGYLRATARGRAFNSLPLPGYARHVLAVRLDAGLESGSLSPGFDVGGASGGSVPVPLDIPALGSAIGFPVRGYPAGTQVGNRAFAASAEYRFPIALVERGIGLVPLSLGRVWGDLFADAGSAWCAGTDELCSIRTGSNAVDPDPLYSVGAELVSHVRFGFVADLPVRVGVALPLRGDPYSSEPTFYVRLGRAF